jgi:3alpha(or 20beta)-hydroxysteroid dehydrogenase
MKTHNAGSIINVSSIWGTAAVPGAHAYHATMGALVMMSKNAAITHVGDGIRVNTIHPGFIDTADAVSGSGHQRQCDWPDTYEARRDPA